MHQFAFQGAAEAFHRRVIPAVSFATHGRLHAKLPKQLLVGMGAILTPAIRVVKQSFPASVDARPGFRFPAGRPLVGAPVVGVYARRDSRFRILPIIGTRAPPGADVAAALFVRISPRLLREIRRTLFSRSRSSLTASDRNSAVYTPFGMCPICFLRLVNSTKRWTPLFPAYASRGCAEKLRLFRHVANSYGRHCGDANVSIRLVPDPAASLAVECAAKEEQPFAR